MLRFSAPFFFTLLPLPWLIWWFRQRLPGRQGDYPSRPPSGSAILHSQTEILARLQAQQGTAGSSLTWVWPAVCCLFLIALAQPRWLAPTDRYETGRDFMLAIDVSGSMRALDFSLDGKPASRLAMLKHVVDGFLDERRHDQIGVVAFADQAYTVVPMTTDMALVHRYLLNLRQGILGEKTALGEAIALAVKRLRNRPGPARVLVLLTDGTNTSGNITPDDALRLAQYYQVHIYPVGIGHQGDVPFPRGPRESPDLVELPLDESLLTRLATASGGRYFHVATTDDLHTVVDAIDRLEPSRIPADSFPYEDWYWLPTIIGIVLLSLERVIKTRRVIPG